MNPIEFRNICKGSEDPSLSYNQGLVVVAGKQIVVSVAGITCMDTNIEIKPTKVGFVGVSDVQGLFVETFKCIVEVTPLSRFLGMFGLGRKYESVMQINIINNTGSDVVVQKGDVLCRILLDPDASPIVHL